MLRSIFVLLVLLGQPSLASEGQENSRFTEAIHHGGVQLSSRLRVEQVDDDSKPDTATALTNRLVLGYKTGDVYGFSALLEFEDITALDNDEEYNTGPAGSGFGNGRTEYATIADPELSAINQLYVSGHGLKLGRQKVILGNARFVGDVAWRQNDQVFNGLSYENKDLIPLTAFQLAYFSQVTDIFGATREITLPMLAFKLTPTKGWDVHAVAYAVDEQETPLNSWQHRGLRTTIDYANVLADVSAVQQSDYADGSSADADYRDLQLGYRLPWLTIKAQHETLEPGFKTPLATLHAFNGWADRFLATPATGLVDRNLKLLGSLAEWSWLLAAHRFEADEGGADFGKEINASLSYKFPGNVSVLLKYADYRGDADAPTLPLRTDLQKIWLQLQWQM